MGAKEYTERLGELLEDEDAMYRKLIKDQKCPAPVELLKGEPIGMFHCEVCGSMVIAGVPHVEVDPPFDPECNIIAAALFDEKPYLWEDK